MTKEQKMQKYKAVFDSLDADRSGFLSSDELLQAVIALGKDPSDLEEIFGVTADRKTELSLEEFVNLMEQIEAKLSAEIAAERYGDDDDDDSEDGRLLVPIDEEEAALYRTLFATLDSTNKGRLSAEDLHTYIRNMSLREASMSAEELNFYFALVEAADNSPDGTIDIEGFALVASDHEEFFRMYAATNPAQLNRDNTRASKLFKSVSTDSVSRVLQRVNSKDKEMYRRVFDEFDHKKIGRVAAEDVNRMMNKLGRVPSTEENAFLFELLQMAGDAGFTFEEFVALMVEDEGSIAQLGRSISRWQGKGVDNDKRKSFKLIKANISRLGLKAAVEKEDARLKKEEVKLQKIGGAGASGYQLPGANNPRQQVSLSPSPLSPSPLSPTSTSPFTDRSMFVDTSRLQSDPHNPLVPASSLLTPLELIRYRTVFNMLDVDQDGSVTCQEMMQSTRTVTGRQPAEVEVREFMDLTDTNGNGSMEFDEFVVVMQRTKRALGRMGTPRTEFTMTSEQRKREKYKQVFDSFDLNRDGRISPDELKQKLQSMGKTVDDGNCRTLFSTYDLNRDGVLDFEEFIPMMDALVARELSL